MKEKTTVERIRQAFWYNKKTGELIWLIQSGYRAVPGARAGSIHTDQEGYRSRYITLDKKLYKSAHVIWIWMTGTWPSKTIDHKNRDSLDDRWDNLREASQAQQQQNKGLQKNNTTGFKCVYFEKDRNHWTVKVGVNKKRFRLGYYKTAEEAHEAHLKHIESLHGEFANAGTS